MATLTERVQVVGNQTFQNRCMMARFLVALERLRAPENSSPGEISIAHSAVQTPLDHPERVAAMVADNDAIADAEISGTGATDEQIMQQLRDNWVHFG